MYLVDRNFMYDDNNYTYFTGKSKKYYGRGPQLISLAISKTADIIEREWSSLRTSLQWGEFENFKHPYVRLLSTYKELTKEQKLELANLIYPFFFEIIIEDHDPRGSLFDNAYDDFHVTDSPI